jgi:hypothetical protein
MLMKPFIPPFHLSKRQTARQERGSTVPHVSELTRVDASNPALGLVTDTLTDRQREEGAGVDTFWSRSTGPKLYWIANLVVILCHR